MTVYDPIAILCIDVDAAAIPIDYWFGELFRKPEPAIYVKGEETPRISLDNLKNYRLERTGRPLTRLDNITSIVLDRHDVAVIDQQDLRRGVALTPTVPYIARNLVEAVIKDLVESRAAYELLLGNHFETALDLYLEPQYAIDLSLRDKISDALMPVYDQVSSFVEGPTYNVHFVKRNASDLIVEKCDDFRIYEYHRITGTKYKRER